MQEPQKILAALGLSPSEVTTYLAMLHGALSAHEIIKVTRQKRPTVYYALGCLEKRGLVSKSGLEGEHRFATEPLARLKTIVAERTKEAAALGAALDELLPTFVLSTAVTDKKPHVAFFEGVDAVKNVIMETLYCREKHIYTIAPHNNFFNQLSKEFVASYVSARVSRKIKTKTLWEQAIATNVFEQYYADLSEVRILPAIMKDRFATTIFLYDDKVLYISSLKNAYSILIHSKEHHDTMKACFDGLWVSSKKHAEEQQKTKK